MSEILSTRPPSDQRADLGDDLADAVFSFRRVMRRVVRQSFPGATLPTAEAELLAFVGRAKGTGVGDAAQALLLAPNTVSTLVGRLVDAGLLERRADPTDGRAARLQLTSAGAARVRQWRRVRTDILARALDTLDDGEREALTAALAPLRRLGENMDNLVPEDQR